MASRPNIVLFNVEHFRADVLAHLGNPASATPNLDRIAETDGVSFRHAFCQNPVCTPSRCSFMTGWYPHVHGHRTMHHMLHAHEPVLLRTLKDAGYYVWWAGRNDLIPGDASKEPYCHRYHSGEEYRPPEGPAREAKPAFLGSLAKPMRGEPGSDTYYSMLVGELEAGPDGRYFDWDWANLTAAIDLVRDPPDDRPLCLYIGMSRAAPPFGIEEPWYSLIDRDALPPRTPAPESWEGKPAMMRGIWERRNMQSWSEERWNEMRAVYYGMCARLDHQFGLLMDALREADIYDDTAAFFFADHGVFAGSYGLVEKAQNVFPDCLTNVPLVVKPPASAAVQPRVTDALAELIDIPATVEALTGVEAPHTHFGRSLLPVLAGETDEHRDAVFCEGGRLKGETHCSEGGAGRESFYWPKVAMQVSERGEHGKAVMLRTRDLKYVYRLYETEELYDLCCDPGELHNVIADPRYADDLAALKERMLRFMVQTADVVPHKLDSR